MLSVALHVCYSAAVEAGCYVPGDGHWWFVVGAWAHWVASAEGHVDVVAASDAYWFALCEYLFAPFVVLGSLVACAHRFVSISIREMLAWGYPLARAWSALMRRAVRFSRQYKHGHVPALLSIQPLKQLMWSHPQPVCAQCASYVRVIGCSCL